MSTQADIPSNLTNDYKAFAFQYLDTTLNSIILEALLYGEQDHYVFICRC